MCACGDLLPCRWSCCFAMISQEVAGRLCSMMAHCARLLAHMPRPCWAGTPLPHSQSLAPSAASARSSAGRRPHMLRGSWCIPSWQAGTYIPTWSSSALQVVCPHAILGQRTEALHAAGTGVSEHSSGTAAVALQPGDRHIPAAPA